ncbi:unnamed protein product [Prunus armeniaca]|uniref:Uncharacterized protein n=1 Tax=Prunus armeniaca TaxID=36596 RepID=A0A6J5X685_PRUAR|nr:unnamed protein product [Prunus armeniaca]
MSSSEPKAPLAAVAWGAGKPLVIEEVNVNPPQAMEIRIKVACPSLCRSDITAWESQVAQGAKLRGASQIIGGSH